MVKHVGRKFFHLFGGLGLLSLYWLLGRRNALIGYGLIALMVLAFEITRFKVYAFQRFIQAWFGSFIRENEGNKLTGMIPYVLGVGLTLFLYPVGIASAAIVFLACGDVMATTVGEHFGKTKIVGGKSLEGTLAFFAAAVGSGVLLSLTALPLPFGLMLAGAAVATAVEVLPLPLNDNLTIPVISGGVMELIARTAGLA